jgi:hypothetical protein
VRALRVVVAPIILLLIVLVWLQFSHSYLFLPDAASLLSICRVEPVLLGQEVLLVQPLIQELDLLDVLAVPFLVFVVELESHDPFL